MSKQRFVVIGIDHRHVYSLTQGLLDAGLDCAGYWSHGSDPHVLEGFRQRFPALTGVPDTTRLLEDASATIMVCAAGPCDRAALAVEAMRHGKDVMMDKPGVTTAGDLAMVDAWRCGWPPRAAKRGPRPSTSGLDCPSPPTSSQ